MIKKKNIAYLGVVFVTATAVQAATIDWTAFDISDVNDVITAGTSILAISAAGSADVGSTFDVAGTTFTHTDILGGDFSGDVSGLTPTGDAGYDELIGTIDFNSGAAASLFQLNLDVVDGQDYILQVWYADDNTSGRVNTITGSGDNVLQGDDYAVGTFTANAITQLLEITTSGGATNNGVRLTGYQLRAVPEPSSYTLLAGCLALGAVMVRRRK